MRNAGIAAAVLSVAGALCAAGAVEWRTVGRGTNREFVRIFSEQTGTNSVKKAGPDTLVFHFDTNDAFVAFHARNAGRKEIRLPRKVRRVVDMFARRLIASDTDRFAFDARLHESFLFYYGD